MYMRATWAFVSASLLFSWGLMLSAAQTPAAAQASRGVDPPLKVAVIQFQQAVTATNEFQRDFAVVQKQFAPKETELKSLQDQIETLTKQLQADGEKLSEPERQERARTIDNKQKQAQRLAQDDQSDDNTAVQDLLSKLAQKVGDVLTTYAKDHGYTLVFDRSEPQQGTPVVLWANPATDITKEVVEAYNAKSGVAAPLPAAPGPAASH
jgi:outer membrane protein